MKAFYLITTVGTSLLTNLKNQGRDDVKKIEERPFFSNNDYIDYYIKDLKNAKNQILDYLKNLGDEDKTNFSAELKSTVFKEKEILEQLPANEEIEVTVHLLATDTLTSVLCAEIVGYFLENDLKNDRVRRKVLFDCLDKQTCSLEIKNNNPSHQFKHIINNLNLDNYNKQGMMNLIDTVSNILDQQDEKSEVYFNISGGYKALTPIMTIMAQLYKKPLFYIYENSDKVITINSFPVSYSWEEAESFISLLFNDNQRKKENNKEIVSHMQNLGLVDNDKELTPLGHLYKKYFITRPSPFTETLMGYIVEHKLFKYYLEKYKDYNKVKHSVKVEGSEDIDILIEENDKVIAIEIKDTFVFANTFDRWYKLKSGEKNIFERIKKFEEKQNKTVKEFWLIVYGERKPDEEEVNKMNEIVELFKDKDIVVKSKYLKVKPSSLSRERHRYQEFFKENIKDNDIVEIFSSEKDKNER